ncbi:hypothetical protein VDG1235_988 [Verrucomicrobiia bacterium DG1235]|nr:hypothetical protein VDG1235_988 [Verrucomicrobiae bacterium DG1235]
MKTTTILLLTLLFLVGCTAINSPKPADSPRNNLATKSQYIERFGPPESQIESTLVWTNKNGPLYAFNKSPKKYSETLKVSFYENGKVKGYEYIFEEL